MVAHGSCDVSLVLRSYKMTTDCGFAPNPRHGVLSLACCKSDLRRVAVVGEWIAGFTSKGLNNDPVGAERLVFLVRVGEIIPRNEYYERFPQKRHGLGDVCGDNIYVPQKNGDSYTHCGCPGAHHAHPKNQADDARSHCILLGTEFYYFGRCPMSIEQAYRPNVPARQSRYGSITTGEAAERFIRYVKQYAAKTYPGKSGMFAEPHTS